MKTSKTSYPYGKEYTVFVQAKDRSPTFSKSGNREQLSEVAVLSVVVGDRPPQFSQQEYEVSAPEDTPVDGKLCLKPLCFKKKWYLMSKV